MSQVADLTTDVEKSRRSPETEQARKRQKNEPVTFSDSNSLVTFIIGKEGETVKFTAHKEVVCYHSKVLDAAFNGDFIEGQTQIYRLEDTTEGVFKLFMQWIYSRKLRLKLLEKNCLLDTDSWEQNTEIFGLFKLWVLADRLCMPCLQNAVIIALEKVFDKQNSIFELAWRYIYHNTAIDSPLRRYIVANLGRVTTTDGIFGQCSGNYPRQLLVNFADYILSRPKDLTKRDYEFSDFFVKVD